MTDAEPLRTRRIWSAEEEARYWRARAGEVRKIETMFSDPASRAKLEEIACHYDDLANQIESRQGER
jgi:flagellar hook-associated protein FlgK